MDTVFGGAFTTMRRYGRPLFGLAALAYVGLGVLIAGAAGVAYAAVADHLHTLYDTPRHVPWTDARPVVVAFVGVWAFGMVATLATNALIQASCVATLHDAVLGRRATLAQVWRRAWPRTPSVLGVTLLMGLIVLIPMLVLALAFFGLFLAVVFRTSLPLGLFFLLALLMVPLTVWLYVLFGFAPAAAVLEAARPVQAMRRSVRLVRGAWWRTFGITLLGGLTVLIVSLAIRLPLTFAMPSPQPYDASAPPPTDISDAFAQTLPDIGLYMALSVAGSLVAQLFAMVFLPLITTLLYIDQRIRKEGLADVLLRVSGSPGSVHE
ncbi:hypothetical protein [Streptomyces sp. R41]|uniref:DUF7847 domain-containing protein n=1 Tax=Streptomyces sp. R41 TaxID=3238632 RepID=A0AB39RHR6_9ACTN